MDQRILQLGLEILLSSQQLQKEVIAREREQEEQQRLGEKIALERLLANCFSSDFLEALSGNYAIYSYRRYAKGKELRRWEYRIGGVALLNADNGLRVNWRDLSETTLEEIRQQFPAVKNWEGAIALLLYQDSIKEDNHG